MYFFQHDIGEEEIEAVVTTMREGHLTTGKVLKEFEEALIGTFGFPGVVLCSSGTAAMFLALHALGVGPGDEVITTPYSIVATPNCILMCGATPVFVDIDPLTYNIDPERVEEAITEKTKAVLAVSVLGNPCDYQKLRALVPSHIRIVSDDIEALGSTRYGKYVGADMGDDVSCGGFWVSKQVTTAGGGMVVSGDKDLLYRIEKLTRHGHGLVGDLWDQHFGFNFWLNDPMAAMGVVQIKRMPEKQARLLKVKAMLHEHFRNQYRQRLLPGHTMTEFVYVIELWGVEKKMYADLMAVEGIPTRPYFNMLTDAKHLEKYRTKLPCAEYVTARTIALPYHWKMTQDDVQSIATAHRKVMESM